jgi:hypothetical protein
MCSLQKTKTHDPLETATNAAEPCGRVFIVLDTRHFRKVCNIVQMLVRALSTLAYSGRGTSCWHKTLVGKSGICKPYWK